MQLYSFFLGLGALAGLLLSGWRAPQKEVTRYLDASLGILFASLVGARLVTVMAGWSYYQAHLTEIIQVWLGGLSGVGALAGAVVGILIISIGMKLPVGTLADTFIPLVGTMAVAAWLGSWVSGSGYGAASSAWWALPARDEWGVIETRVPVQLLGAFLSLALTGMLDRLGIRLGAKGTGSALSLFGLSVVIFGLSFLRADPALVIYGLRLEAWGALGLMVVSTILLVVLLLSFLRGRRLAPKT